MSIGSPDSPGMMKAVGGALAVFLASALWAAETPQLYVRADFNELTTGSLAGQGGGTGFAASSTWSGKGNIRVGEGDLSAVPPEGERYVRSQYGTSLRIEGDAGRATRTLEEPISGTIWFSFLVHPVESGGAGIEILHTGKLETGVAVASVGQDLHLRWPGTTREERPAGVFASNTTSLVLGRLDIDTGVGGEDSLSVWVNPVVTNPGNPLLKVSKMSFIDGPMTGLALVVHGDDGEPGAKLDELVLSNYEGQAGYFHAAPRLRFTGPYHIPTSVAETVTPLPPAGYMEVWSDEFDGDVLDAERWEYRLRAKADSAQLAENVEVSDGHLIIHARKRRVGQYNYTGGGVISRPTFVYGYYEARLKVPSAEGWHTSFWTFPVWDEKLKGSELDFCEQDSGDPHLYSLGVIDQRVKGWNRKNVGRWVVEDVYNMAEEFVTIGADFTPDSIRFYLNGRLVNELESARFPQGPNTVRLSCIATRKKGDRFQDDARLPNQAVFDYVRVYQNPKYRTAEAARRLAATRRAEQPDAGEPTAPVQPGELD